MGLGGFYTYETKTLSVLGQGDGISWLWVLYGDQLAMGTVWGSVGMGTVWGSVGYGYCMGISWLWVLYGDQLVMGTVWRSVGVG